MKGRLVVFVKGYLTKQRVIFLGTSVLMLLSMLGSFFANGIIANAAETTQDANPPGVISNDSLRVKIGDLGQIEFLHINNNRLNNSGREVNFVLPNDTSPQNGPEHQWMGEMIFSYRTSEDGEFPEGREGFVEVDTNKTLAAGGSTTYSNATENLATNPYIEKNVVSDKRVEINFIGQDENSTTPRTMKGFDVKSVFDMDTEDGSLLWEITLTNKSSKYIEFGDVGLPMPWNNKYTSRNSVYNERVTVHTFAGADSGYAYAIRCSGEGNFILFVPVPESGARIEYIDNWVGNNNGVSGERNSSLFRNWTCDSGGWQPGLSVYYIHSKDISKTGRGYFTDKTSLILAPGESKTYQFKFYAVRAGDNSPQESADSPNNASNSMEEREKNMRSILYNNGMVDAIAVPGFQTVINMPTKLALHYNDEIIRNVEVDIQCVHENDPFDQEHIPVQQAGLVNNRRGGRGLHDGNPNYNESCKFVEKKIVDGEQYHIYDLTFGCIGNNSVRVEYELKVGDKWEKKFTQYEFNVMAELDEAVETHSKFMLDNQHDDDPESPTYGIYKDWYLASGEDPNTRTHWGDDWSHDNVNFMAMKNYMIPDPEEIESLERYLIDFMWENYMKYTQDKYIVANYLRDSGIYSSSSAPYTRTFSEMMVVTAYFNMYRIQKAYPDLMDYRAPRKFYLDKAYNIYYNRVGSGTVGFYGEQQVPDIIEALRAEGMIEEANNLQRKFARDKGRAMANAQYPYGSEFAYDNTGEEGAYAAAKALRTYYPEDSAVGNALRNMEKAEWKTRAMRGIQPTWYHYGNPVFIGGEHWWNFQYTASLAGSIMDDWLRYQDNEWDTDSRAWAQRVNYAAKLSNFNAINMGQISDKYIGSVSWRYTMYKGGHGAMDVYDGGTRVMNNGWNDFSGEADEGIYGSLLLISADVVTDPIFGLVGYGSEVSKDEDVYKIIPKDGFGKRFNVIDDKIYVSLVQDACTDIEIKEDGTYIGMTIKPLVSSEHLSQIQLSGGGIKDGFYSIKLDGEDAGQCYVKDNKGVANVIISGSDTVKVVIEKMDGGENQAPYAKVKVDDEDIQALVPFEVDSIAYDDGAPEGTLTYKWEASKTPEDATLTFTEDTAPTTEAVASAEGEYEIALTVSDGDLSYTAVKTITVNPPPERQAPEIGEVTAVQDSVNISVAHLNGEATGDPFYKGELEYEWSVIEQPEDSEAIIGDKDQSSALLKVSKPGTYVVRLTVTDADVSSYKDVTIEMVGDVDGVYRALNVITQQGSAPELPEYAEIILPDGTVGDAEVAWDDIDPEDYESEGSLFFVEGEAVESGDKVKVAVYVVSGDSENLALYATPTAIIDTPHDLGGVTKLNDGIDPSSSSDTSNGVWHNWLGDQGGPAWVQYTWQQPILAESMDVYVFRDGNGNFRPKDMQVTLRDENGNWYTPRNVDGLENALNRYNHTTFEPALITGIRIDMKPVTLGCGIIEWKVNGYDFFGVLVDKSELRALYDHVDSLTPSRLVGGLEPAKDAIDAAKAVLDNAEATQEEVDQAVVDLVAAMKKLVPRDGNLAYVAGLRASYTSSWESLPAVRDGRRLSGGHWGTWGNTSRSEWIEYTWPQGVTIDASDLYIWNDGGGIKTPLDYTYSYLPMDSDEWVTLVKIDSGIVANALNHTKFDEPVEVRALRCTLTKERYNSEGIGLWEWEVYAPGDIDALEALIAQAEEIEGRYTEDSWNAFIDALDAAKAVLEDEDAYWLTVNDAINDLQAKIDALEEIPPVLEEVIMEIDSDVIERTKTAQLSLIAKFDTGETSEIDVQQATFISLNENIATVDENGVVTGVKVGTTEISAIVEIDGIVYEANTVEITVEELKMEEVEGFALSYNPSIVEVGEEAVITITAQQVADLAGFDVRLSYDNDLLELKSVEFNESFGYSDYLEKEGIINVLAVLTGQDSGLTGDVELVNLVFKAKDKDALASITLLGGSQISDIDTAIYTIEEDIAAKIPIANSDVTGGGTAINDLVLVAKAFDPIGDRDIYDARLDMNKDGVIDIIDIAYVAARILKR